MKTITSRDNPTFKDLHDLAVTARRQKREGRALLEGPHLVAAALDHGVVPELVAVAEEALDHPEIAALLVRIPGVPVLCLRSTLFREVSELKTPVGILARIAVPKVTKAGGAVSSAPSLRTGTAGDCLLLDAIQDAGNVGTLLRTAAAAGVRDVLLGPGCAGAWTQRVLRAAQGAHFSLAIHENVDLAAFVQSFSGRSLAAVAHGGESLYALDFSQPTAWLFGNEGAGLSPDLVALATKRATIPLAPDSESLNVAAAAAVCLFEMRRQREFG
ncbi:TrmH family RNA methyltransferase [Sulfuricystis multivorans]|uniref:TrmH family RNA methyltransferase n=1 Tax=Sulfuricystis multivorans TaxID=2211108 RepID=UPI000F81DF89|nr:RNA methyltransferase [Sulfuricystis multivorans]